MEWWAWVLIGVGVVAAGLMLLGLYCCCVVAARADAQAERMLAEALCRGPEQDEQELEDEQNYQRTVGEGLGLL